MTGGADAGRLRLTYKANDKAGTETTEIVDRVVLSYRLRTQQGSATSSRRPLAGLAAAPALTGSAAAPVSFPTYEGDLPADLRVVIGLDRGITLLPFQTRTGYTSGFNPDLPVQVYSRTTAQGPGYLIKAQPGTKQEFNLFIPQSIVDEATSSALEALGSLGIRPRPPAAPFPPLSGELPASAVYIVRGSDSGNPSFPLTRAPTSPADDRLDIGIDLNAPVQIFSATSYKGPRCRESRRTRASLTNVSLFIPDSVNESVTGSAREIFG